MSREIRTKKADLMHDKIVQVKRATKKKKATVTFLVDDDLAKRLITNLTLPTFSSDFAAVGLMLEWVNIDYA